VQEEFGFERQGSLGGCGRGLRRDNFAYPKVCIAIPKKRN
jgi:hypothetical protein